MLQMQVILKNGNGKGNAKQQLISCINKSADQEILVPEDPMGETDYSTFVLCQDNK